MMTTEPLSLVTKAEAEAIAAAEKAQRAAAAATERAAAARAQAESERAARLVELADKLTAEWPAAHETAITALGDARTALETAIHDGGDIFRAYRAVVRASVNLWEVDSALAQIRDLTGRPTRETPMPAFDFAHDIAAIINRQGLELVDDGQARIVQRRATYLSGQGG